MPQIAPDQIRDFHFVSPSDDIVAKLNNVNSGDIIFLAEGTYSIASQIVLSGVRDVTIIGSKGSVLDITYDAAPPFVLRALENVSFIGFTVYVNGTTASQDIFRLDDGGTNVIKYLSFINLTAIIDPASGSHMFVRQRGTTSLECTDVMVQGCSFQGSGNSTILRIDQPALTSGKRFLCIGNRSERDAKGGSTLFGFFVGGGSTIEQISIIGNNAINCSELFGCNGGTGVSDYICANNNVKDSGSGAQQCIYLGGAKSGSIIGNVVKDYGGNRTFDMDGSHVTCVGNALWGGVGPGINVTSAGTIVCDNVVEDHVGNGIIADADHIVVANNKVFNNTTNVGDASIKVASGRDECVVVENYVNISYYGILVDAAPRVSVALNVIVGATDDAVAFTSGSDYGSAFGNIIVSPGARGVECDGTDCTIGSNVITDATTDGIATTANSNRNTISANVIFSPNSIGISLVDGVGHVVSGNVVSAATGDSIDIASAADHALILGNYINGGQIAIDVNSSTNTVASNSVLSSGAEGIAVSGDDNLIIGNRIASATGNGIFLEATANGNAVIGNYSKASTIDNYHVDDTDNYLASNVSKEAGGNGYTIDGARNSVVACYSNNDGNAVTERGISATGSDVFISSCYVYSSYDHGIYTSGTQCSVIGCHVFDCGTNTGDYGIDIIGTRSLVSSCYVNGGPDDGIYVAGSQSNVCGCYVESSTSEGIIAIGDDINVTGCYVRGTTDYAFNIVGNGCTLSGCQADGTAGFIIQGTSSTVTGCVVRSSAGQGFEVTSTGDFTNIAACMSVSSTAAGFLVNSGAVNVNLNTCYSYDSRSHGYSCAGNFTNLTACYSYDDGNAGSEYGFNITGTQCTLGLCYVYDSYDHGFYVTGNEAHLVGCRAYNVGDATGAAGSIEADGIHLNGSDYSSVVGSHVVGSAAHGIHLDESDECLVNSNRCYNNGPTATNAIDSFTATNTITFEVAVGDVTALYPIGRRFTTTGASTGANNGTFTVQSVDYNVTTPNATTVVTVETTIVNEAASPATASPDGSGILEDSDCDNNLFGVNHLRGNNAGTNFAQLGTNATTGVNKF